MSDSQAPVVVRDLRLEKNGDVQRMSASVDGFELWFQMSAAIPLMPRVEAFLAPAMLEAMVRNAPVVVEDGATISPQLVDGLSTVQSIFRCWNTDLHPVEIRAEISEPETRIDGAICCFSGGVDSSYTYACNERDISYLLVVQGFDAWRKPNDWKENVAARARFADAAGKKLIAVDSNVREFFAARDIYWGLGLGGVLAGLGVSLAPKIFFIPSSWTYQDLIAYGSHPLVDPMWSTEATRVVHHGCDTRRSEKIVRIAESQQLLDQLQVCWRSCSRNCGECPKCVRTSLVLHFLEKQSENLPPYTSPRQLKVLRPKGVQTLPYLNDLILASRTYGARDIERRLLRIRKQFLIQDSVRTLVQALTGQWGRRLYHRLDPQDWHTKRATIRSPKSPF